MRKYEAMFLFDPMATTEWDAIQGEVNRLLERANAKLILIHKWDERRLAYEIKGRKRGIYVLCYFEADPEVITKLEGDCRLSEMILRAMVLKVDHLSEEEMKEIAARPAAQDEGPPRRDHDRGPRDRDRDRGDRDRGDRDRGDRDRGDRDRGDRDRGDRDRGDRDRGDRDRSERGPRGEEGRKDSEPAQESSEATA